MKYPFILAAMSLELVAMTTAKADENPTYKTAIDEVKIYQDTDLQDSKVGKDGSVYQVKGSEKIDGKDYDKVYQNDEFCGYIKSDQLRSFIAQKDEREVKIIKSDYERWDNFYWSRSLGKAEKDDKYEVKERYQIGNGKNYYKLYKDGKFAGFINANATDEPNVWTTSQAIILYKRIQKHNSGKLDQYLQKADYDYKHWEPVYNKKNTIILKRTVGEETRYLKLISSGAYTILFIADNEKMEKPAVEFIVQNNSAKIIKTVK